MSKLNKVYFIIFSLSAVTLMFEIVLARVFSYILTYHFVYIIIAIAILSHALGQLFASRIVLKKSYSLPKYFVTLQLMFPISMVAIFILPSISMMGSASTGIILYTFLAGISFFIVGLICAIFFHQYQNKISLLYALDLTGAAIGALLGLFLLNTLSLVSTISVILLIISISSFIIIIDSKSRHIGYIFTNISILLFSSYIILFTPVLEIPIAKSTDKDLLRLQNNPSIKSEILDTRWNSFGRTDLVKFSYPDSSSSRSMFIDGAAGTEIFDIAELEKDSVKRSHTLRHANLYFPFYFLKSHEKDSALIIGPGGGLDIAVAYFGNVNIIDAVEVNPTFVDMMKEHNKTTFSEQTNINIYVQEGRNFVRNTPNKYDLIFLTIPITKGVRSTDYINLTENYLFTVNALEDYLSILTTDGRIVLTLHNREEVYKVLSNYLEFQKQKGISNAEALKHIYVADRGMKPVLVIKKNAFRKKEIIPRHLLSHQFNFDRGLTFFPLVEQISVDTSIIGQNYRINMFDEILNDISKHKYSFHDISEKASINLHPVYDDSPFFFNYELGIPQNLAPLIFIAIFLLVWSIYMFKTNWGIKLQTINNITFNKNANFKYISVITFLLGLTYIIIQSYLFQKLNLHLSNPLNSFSLLLFTFLIGNGIGSFISSKVLRNRLLYVSGSVFTIIVVLVAEIIILSYTSKSSLSEPILALIVFLPSIFIGLPFPLILSEVSQNRNSNEIPVLLGISGIAGFIGSILVLVLATTLGYIYTVALGIVLYLIILGILVLNGNRNKMNRQKIF